MSMTDSQSPGLLKLIKTRRSVRRFTGNPVDENARRELLEAAMQAPSAVNKQPWSFIVVDQRETLDRIAEIHRAAQMMRQAPLAIAVCGERGRAHRPEQMDQDCSAATENILLAAHALGLGSVWCGIYPNKERVAAFRELLGIPEHITPFAVVAIGEPAEQPEQPDRWRPELVHYNRW